MFNNINDNKLYVYIFLIIIVVIIIYLIYLYTSNNIEKYENTHNKTESTINVSQNIDILINENNLYKKNNLDYNLNINKIGPDNYQIIEIPNFLSDEECNFIMEVSKDKLSASTVVGDNRDNNDVYDTNTRNSLTAWLEKNKYQVDIKISNLATFLTKRPTENFENLQVLYYPLGGFFSPHYDATEMNSDSNTKYREYTLIIYLNNVEEGGETSFPKINVDVKPEKGKVVLFRTLDDNNLIIPESLHQGKPILKGEKWICNKWIHIKSC